jgi:hypothetical protein
VAGGLSGAGTSPRVRRLQGIRVAFDPDREDTVVKHRLIVSTLLTILLAASAGAATPLPKTVQTSLDTIAADCASVGGRPVTTDAVKRADLTGDGAEDYVLDVGSINCDGAPGIFGDREKLVTVFVGDGKGGAVEAYRGSAFGVKLEGTGQSATVWLTLMGQDCGRQAAANFASESFCERALKWNAATRKFDPAPEATVRMIE